MRSGGTRRFGSFKIKRIIRVACFGVTYQNSKPHPIVTAFDGFGGCVAGVDPIALGIDPRRATGRTGLLP
jgi:hypothetical protein